MGAVRTLTAPRQATKLRFPSTPSDTGGRGAVAGYVHLAKNGRTGRPASRLQGLRSGAAEPVVALHGIPCHDLRAVAFVAHKRHASRRLQGAWFDLARDDVSWIMAISEVTV